MLLACYRYRSEEFHSVYLSLVQYERFCFNCCIFHFADLSSSLNKLEWNQLNWFSTNKQYKISSAFIIFKYPFKLVIKKTIMKLASGIIIIFMFKHKTILLIFSSSKIIILREKAIIQLTSVSTSKKVCTKQYPSSFNNYCLLT